MALYRVLKNLDTGKRKVQRGDFVLGSSFDPAAIDRLEAVGAIGLLYAPPLAELPDFGDEAKQLATIGIVQADQFMEADIDEIARQLSTSSKMIREWRATVSNWLIVPEQPRRG